MTKDRGVSGTLLEDPLTVSILAATTAVAWVYAIELNITIFLVFKRKAGLYFWSLLIASWGLTFHALGFVLKFLVGSTWLLTVPFITVGWVAMVTGQAFVLYSRLHLVVRNPKTLRYVLSLIIFDVFALHVPTVIFTYGSNSPNNTNLWTASFNVMERIQLAGFCIQETIISTLYVLATVRMLRSIYHSSTRKVMIQLIFINFCCIGMDVLLICLEYTGKYVSEASIKPMIYAIKLKLEFTVLNQLMDLASIGLTEDKRRRGSLRHELQTGNRPSPHTTDGSVWRAAVKDKPTDSCLRGTIPKSSNEIFKTQEINIVSEDISSGSPESCSDFSLGPRSPPHSLQRFTHNPDITSSRKGRSLMGTTHVELGPQGLVRSSMRGGADGTPRNKSPTESEQALNPDNEEPGEKERSIDDLKKSVR
ncbi:hypothetical protein MMC31_006976 [Peltigera leucophlebia]|nr:hypothetical protein [Peltigera leucophlebia]